MHTDTSIETLLKATIQAHITPATTLIRYKQLPHDPAIPKINVQRFAVTLADGRTIHLITKPSPLIERRVLQLLNQQKHAIIPFCHSRDMTSTEALICMEDAGKEIEPDEQSYRQQIAAGLAGIHALNLGKEEELAWLPKTDHAYFAEFILGWTWRLSWERAIEDSKFVAHFGDFIPKVEASAKIFPDVMQTLFDNAKTRTLIHTDIYFGHVLARGDLPFIVDWGQAHYGAFYLDLPSHFDTPEKAELYRHALEKHQIFISKDEFMRQYHVASRFVGFRYMWWWIEEWRKHPADWNEQGVLNMLNKAIG